MREKASQKKKKKVSVVEHVLYYVQPDEGRDSQPAPSWPWVISPKYLPSEPAEECTHVMSSCADITGESKPIPLLNPASAQL